MTTQKRVKASSRIFISAGLLAVVGVTLLASPSSGAGQPIGGFSMTGFGAPVSFLVYEPEIPVPTSPQGELHYSFTQAAMDGTPFGSTCSSSVYPGATLGTTPLSTFNPSLPDKSYPVIACAAYPGGPTQKSLTLTAGAGMTAAATQNETTATASSSSSPGQFLSFGNAQSTTTLTSADTRVVGTAVSTVSDIGILSSIIQIKSVHGESVATSDGQLGSFTGTETVSGVTVAGQTFTVDQNGVHPPAKLNNLPPIPLPTVPKSGTQLLDELGVTFSEPAVQSTAVGASATTAGQALVVSVDLGRYVQSVNNVPGLRQLIDLTPNPCAPKQLDPIFSQLPTGSCLHSQVDALLALTTRVVLIFCNTSVQSSAISKYVFTLPVPNVPLPPGATTSTAGIAPAPGLMSPGTPGSPGTPATPSVAGPAPLLASRQFPAGYNGLGAGVLLAALVAGVVGYVLRNVGLGVVTGGLVGCELGAPGGVPNLRRG